MWVSGRTVFQADETAHAKTELEQTGKAGENNERWSQRKGKLKGRKDTMGPDPC